MVIELDDDRNVLYRNPIELGKYVREFCSDGDEYYVFIDEIQLVFSILNPALTGGKIVLAKAKYDVVDEFEYIKDQEHKEIFAQEDMDKFYNAYVSNLTEYVLL